MKTCTIMGDMSSERSSENYPTVPVCDDCVQANEDAKEDSQIVSVGDYDDTLGDKCEFCDKTLAEEKAELD